MQFQKQLEAWERQGKWKRIVKALEKLKAPARDREMNLLLALAYINSLEGEYDKEVMDKIYALVEPLQKELRNDFSLGYYLGQVTYALKNYEKGKNIFKLAHQNEELAQVYLNSDIERVLNNALTRWREVKKSGPSSPFTVRTQQAWETFANHQEELKEQLDKKFQSLPKPRNISLPLFQEAMKGERAVINKKDNKYDLALSGSINILRLFECEYFKNHAPSDVLQNWDISIGQPAVQFSTLDEENRKKLEEVKIWIDDEKDDIFSLSIYSELLHSFHRNPESLDDPKLVTDYGLLLLSVTGTVAFTKYIRFPKPLSKPRDEPSLTLLGFVDYLKEKGVDVYAPAEIILNAPTSYTRNPEENENPLDTTLRADILNGWSKCMRFLQDVENDHDVSSETLENDGAIVGYLFYIPAIQSEDDKEREVKELNNAIKQRLLENLSSEDFEIIGEAHGQNSEYIDIIAWDLKKVLEEAQKVFEQVPVKMGGFNIFDQTSIGLWLTAENPYFS